MEFDWTTRLTWIRAEVEFGISRTGADQAPPHRTVDVATQSGVSRFTVGAPCAFRSVRAL
ncbi:hypothetical protein ACFQ9J_32040 [Streptomyces sp. NPDC056529]|uniref:hypothetical protein n=1 Tax=Streptomyces sp. NPDC056529 TaxID=3345855 RepID=UPI00368366B3